MKSWHAWFISSQLWQVLGYEAHSDLIRAGYGVLALAFLIISLVEHGAERRAK